MSSKFWCLIFGLAVLAVASCSGRVLSLPATAEDGGDSEDQLSNNVETSTGQWESEEWLKVSLAPEAHVEHKLGSPLELECEIMGTPPPQVKWIRGPYNANSVSQGIILSRLFRTLELFFFSFPQQADEFSSNVISEAATGGVGRVRARLFLDHIHSVGDHRFTCIGQVGGQVVHATTTVKTSSSEIFPANVNVHHRGGIPAMELLNRYGMGTAPGPVIPRISLWYNVLLEKIGNPVILPCEAYGQPHPQVYWLDNNNNMVGKHDPRFKTLPNGSLLITNLKWDDMGEFHCVAKNDLGKDTKGTFVYPMLVSVTEII